MLKRLWGKNFACFGDGEYKIDFAPETVIIGPNNVGKSAFIAAFNFLRTNGVKAKFAGGTQWDTATYNWKNFETIIHRHEKNREINIGAILADYTITTTAHLDSYESDFSPSTDKAIVDSEVRKVWYVHALRKEVPPEIGAGTSGLVTPWYQPINPDGSNVVTYLLERFTSRDDRWDEAEKWLRLLAPDCSILKSPLRGNLASIETTFMNSNVDINIAYQGTGIQKAIATMAAIIFSPEGSTIIVEEPEIHLHPRSQEVLVNLFNLAVNDWKKQIIFTTHSWNMLLPFFSDVVKEPTKRGKDHIKAKPENFKLIEFSRIDEDIEIKEIDISEMIFRDIKSRIKNILG